MPNVGAAKRETSSVLLSRKESSAQAAPHLRRAAPPWLGRDLDVTSKQGVTDTQAPALQQQISAVVESLNQTGSPPPGVRQGGLPGKHGVYGNRSGALPVQPEGYYTESDVWPGPGRRGAERIVVGGPGEVWYSPDHYGTFLEWPS
jgi:guanyl-specific ribonuclease Sa